MNSLDKLCQHSDMKYHEQGYSFVVYHHTSSQMSYRLIAPYVWNITQFWWQRYDWHLFGVKTICANIQNGFISVKDIQLYSTANQAHA